MINIGLQFSFFVVEPCTALRAAVCRNRAAEQVFKNWIATIAAASPNNAATIKPNEVNHFIALRVDFRSP